MGQFGAVRRGLAKRSSIFAHWPGLTCRQCHRARPVFGASPARRCTACTGLGRFAFTAKDAGTGGVWLVRLSLFTVCGLALRAAGASESGQLFVAFGHGLAGPGFFAGCAIAGTACAGGAHGLWRRGFGDFGWTCSATGRRFGWLGLGLSTSAGLGLCVGQLFPANPARGTLCNGVYRSVRPTIGPLVIAVPQRV